MTQSEMAEIGGVTKNTQIAYEEEGLADAGATLPPNKKAEVIAKWYQLHYAERDGKKLASVRRAVAELTRSYH